MRRRLLTTLVLLVITPLTGLVWLGDRLADKEHERVEHEVRALLMGRLEELDRIVSLFLEERRRKVAELLSTLPNDDDGLRALSLRSPITSQVFIQDEKGKLVYPSPTGELTDTERVFLERTSALWNQEDALNQEETSDGKASLRSIEILKDEGYETIAAKDGKEAISLCAEKLPDFVCLDVMMPELSGYDVCRELRRLNGRLPIIFISAKSEEIDKVLGLELGADDFIVKPFGVKEVIARIRSVSRRCLLEREKGQSPRAFHLADLEVLPTELRARRQDRIIDLSLRDVQVLELFHQHAGKVLTRDQISRAAWGTPHLTTSRSLDQHISQLRKRIEADPRNPTIIRTVHGAGYRYEP